MTSAAAIALAAAILVLGAFPAAADRGSIPFIPGVITFEPDQRAFIAWNGTTERLVLSTTIRASRRTQVLEVIPFRSEPSVSGARPQELRRAARLYGSKYSTERRLSPDRAGPGLGDTGEDPEDSPPAELTFYQTIGAHSVSVVRLDSEEGFFEWAADYLNGKGVENVSFSPAIRRAVEYYMRNGYRYYVFDVIDAGIERGSVEPVAYTFESEELYYPLIISTTDSGYTSVELYIVSDGYFHRFDGISPEEIALGDGPFPLKREELEFISPAAAALFDTAGSARSSARASSSASASDGAGADDGDAGPLSGDTPRLRRWLIKGYFEDFSEDLLAR